ncbi:MAG: flagellar protein, partial [Melioribacteraceae bacterium]|nr:flagellar protein [Melioribacteraceae bacterium]
MAEINGVSVPFIPIVREQEPVVRRNDPVRSSFNDIFKEELEKVKFSNHALKRLESRNIQFNEGELTRIQNAVDKAELKGAKDSLVLLDNTALIVNIPNKTVVTAIEVN